MRLGAPAVVTVEPAPGGVALHAVADDGRDVVLWLDAQDALTVADELTVLCERQSRLEGVAA
jgi:hypothetical protein